MLNLVLGVLSGYGQLIAMKTIKNNNFFPIAANLHENEKRSRIVRNS